MDMLVKLLRQHLSDVAAAAAVATKSLQLCPTLCDPIDSSPTGSPVPGILQARTLEWVAIKSSNRGTFSPVFFTASPNRK